jgi:hypothetical protein
VKKYCVVCNKEYQESTYENCCSKWCWLDLQGEWDDLYEDDYVKPSKNKGNKKSEME